MMGKNSLNLDGIGAFNKTLFNDLSTFMGYLMPKPSL